MDSFNLKKIIKNNIRKTKIHSFVTLLMLIGHTINENHKHHIYDTKRINRTIAVR